MKPSELFVGVVDLFAIVLPGAVLAFLGKLILEHAPSLDASVVLNLSGAAGWVAFLLAAYVLGHIVFSVGASLDELYDWAAHDRRNQVLYASVARIRLQHEGALNRHLIAEFHEETVGPDEASGWLRVVGWLTHGAWKTRANSRKPIHAINTFKTALSFLQLRHPGALVDVRRLEADSKFFRGAVVLLLVLLTTVVGRALWVVFAATGSREALGGDLVSVGVCFWLLRLSFARYCEQRQKAVELAYQLLVTSVAIGPTKDIAQAGAPSEA